MTVTKIEPWAELGQTKEQFMAYLLDLTEKHIAKAERVLPCSACSACQWTTCRKAGAFRFRRLLLGTSSTMPRAPAVGSDCMALLPGGRRVRDRGSPRGIFAPARRRSQASPEGISGREEEGSRCRAGRRRMGSSRWHRAVARAIRARQRC
jgi:hypothetical protein